MSREVKRVTCKASGYQQKAYTENVSLFRKITTFENKTDETIIVSDRNNIPTVYKCNPNRYRSEQMFKIKTVYEFLGRDMALETLLRLDEFNKQFKVLDENHGLLYKLIQESYDSNPNGNIHVICIERCIGLEDLKKYKCIYEEDSDYLINSTEGWLSRPHPHSAEGKILSGHDEYIYSKKVSGCLIEVVDNDNKIGCRYVYCAKQLIKLNPISDPTRQCGVYFTKVENAYHEADMVDPHHMGFEEAEEKLGLYRTEEEALTGGSPENLAKEKARVALQDLERLKHEAELAKGTNRLKEAALEAELHESRAEQARLKEHIAREEMLRNEEERKRKEDYAKREEMRKDAAQERADYYEQRNQYRRDTSDMFKWLPTLIIGAMGILAYFMKKQ